jgi:hypothetical protein
MVDEGYVDIDFTEGDDTEKKNGDGDKVKHG